jgi:acetoin utilization deacetylase AcuC-like enzyme
VAARRVLVVTAPEMAGHDAGDGNPDAPERLRAVLEGVTATSLGDAVVHEPARPATYEELLAVHPAAHLAALERFCSSGGGWITIDTAAGPGSWPAALLASGAGLAAVAALDAGGADAAFCAVRPPGHHATAVRAQGFCLLNNVAVTALHLANRGERVLIVDYDAHHGNGTQDIVWADPRIAYVSMHQWPLYPGTGRLQDTGDPAAPGLIANLPFPPGTVGPAYRAAVDEVVVPLAERFRPSWLLLSAGFDAHWTDPMADLRLTAGDFNDMTRALTALVPAGRVIAFLEGGYDRAGLVASTSAAVSALAGVDQREESASIGDRGMAVVGRAVEAMAAAVDAA